MNYLQRKLIIVIVNSDIKKSESTERSLKESQYFNSSEVLIAKTGNEAIKIFESKHPDIFIIDSKLEGMASREVSSWIRAHEGERHTGIIIVSSEEKNLDQLSVECLTLGADDFIKDTRTSEELFARINSVLHLKIMTDDLRRANYRLRVLTLTDELTGLANMRGFKKVYKHKVERCSRKEHGLCVIMVDLDNFKSINDNYNHLVGSSIISEAGKLISESNILTEGSVAARYGGDEFILCIEVNSQEEALKKGEKLKDEFKDKVFKADKDDIKLTASVGVSWVPAGFNGPIQDIIKLADIMLYRSKETGRNKVSQMNLKYPIDFDQICKTSSHSANSDENEEKTLRIYSAKAS